MLLLQTKSGLAGISPSRLIQLNDVNVTGPESVELAQTLNEIGVVHYLQNNTALVYLSLLYSMTSIVNVARQYRLI